MRGPSSIWYRIRINLQHVPEDQRPPQEPLLADYSPWENYSGPQWMHGQWARLLIAPKKGSYQSISVGTRLPYFGSLP